MNRPLPKIFNYLLIAIVVILLGYYLFVLLSGDLNSGVQVTEFGIASIVFIVVLLIGRANK